MSKVYILNDDDNDKCRITLLTRHPNVTPSPPPSSSSTQSLSMRVVTISSLPSTSAIVSADLVGDKIHAGRRPRRLEKGLAAGNEVGDAKSTRTRRDDHDDARRRSKRDHHRRRRHHRHRRSSSRIASRRDDGVPLPETTCRMCHEERIDSLMIPCLHAYSCYRCLLINNVVRCAICEITTAKILPVKFRI